ncbi:MAG: cobaltochelatase subunit CobN, partial [Prevotellaceae bacterium]|nr:cobaltochelatase subunit CobN [Prevotellaceae bacterium]
MKININKKTSKSLLIAASSLLLLSTAIFAVWNRTASISKIALINFQPFQFASFAQSNEDKFVKYENVELDNLSKLKNYDFVLGFGMGMQLTVEQREEIKQIADKGTPLYIYAATNPDNNICNLDSVKRKQVSDYLRNGNKRNYQSLARYIRKEIDRKSFFLTPPDSVFETASDVLYHLDENFFFKEVDEYENYLKKNGFYIDNAAKVAIVGGLNDPFSGNRANIDSLITTLQGAKLNVYPVSSGTKRLEFLKSIQPDAVIYFAHGRMAMGQADAAVEWLKSRNIPVFAPLSMLQSQQAWEEDAMGMFGGFMSQSIVMPELDGAIYPYVLNVQEVDEEGLYLFKAIPERLKNFTQIVANFIELKKKRNADKKLAIYY